MTAALWQAIRRCFLFVTRWRNRNDNPIVNEEESALVDEIRNLRNRTGGDRVDTVTEVFNRLDLPTDGDFFERICSLV